MERPHSRSGPWLEGGSPWNGYTSLAPVPTKKWANSQINKYCQENFFLFCVSFRQKTLHSYLKFDLMRFS